MATDDKEWGIRFSDDSYVWLEVDDSYVESADWEIYGDIQGWDLKSFKLTTGSCLIHPDHDLFNKKIEVCFGVGKDMRISMCFKPAVLSRIYVPEKGKARWGFDFGEGE